MSSLSNRKLSAEEISSKLQEDLEEVRLRIKELEYCLKGGTSAPSDDIAEYVPIYEETRREILSSLLVKLQENKNLLLARGM